MCMYVCMYVKRSRKKKKRRGIRLSVDAYNSQIWMRMTSIPPSTRFRSQLHPLPMVRTTLLERFFFFDFYFFDEKTKTNPNKRTKRFFSFSFSVSSSPSTLIVFFFFLWVHACARNCSFHSPPDRHNRTRGHADEQCYTSRNAKRCLVLLMRLMQSVNENAVVRHCCCRSNGFISPALVLQIVVYI
uniref:Uncharacterized protein n=1 Tax=Trypanosoma vivax (strain Y486) TaxID=1055687 RepID=G0TVK6_TRYVY|nr:hypothetical protein TVY486_0501820 [Trypanosoma vivax Y486]